MPKSTTTACLIAMSVVASSACADDANQVDKLQWLVGDWVYSTEKSTTRESWTNVGAGVFKGQGVVTSNSDRKVRSRESLLLVEMGGEVFYIAKVKQNQFPTPFKLTTSSAGHAVFENTDHDFPKRIEYRLGDAGDLKVTVSDGGERGFVLPFSRADLEKGRDLDSERDPNPPGN